MKGALIRFLLGWKCLSAALARVIKLGHQTLFGRPCAAETGVGAHKAELLKASHQPTGSGRIFSDTTMLGSHYVMTQSSK